VGSIVYPKALPVPLNAEGRQMKSSDMFPGVLKNANNSFNSGRSYAKILHKLLEGNPE